MIGSDMLLELYNCPAEPLRWQSVLDGVCKRLGVKSAVVQRLKRKGDFIEQTWTVRDTNSTRNADLHDRVVNNLDNPRFNLAIVGEYQHNEVVRDSDRFQPDCPHYATLRNMLGAVGLGEAISVGTERNEDNAMALILHREAGDGRQFTDDHEQFLLEIAPHIDNALEIAARLERHARPARKLETIAGTLQMGVVICDGERRIQWQNDAADDILRRSPHLRAPSGRLCALGGKRDNELSAILRRVQADMSNGLPDILVLGAGEEDELHVLILPPVSEDDMAALLLSEPRRIPMPSVNDISRLLSVTQAEARVAAAMCAGHTLKEYASSRGICEGSARNQLKQVLAKSGTRRQAELVRHLYGSVVFQARQAPADMQS